ncbi:MAG: hypothetical protein U0822_23455, partial [Anaerolineae bacterium]
TSDRKLITYVVLHTASWHMLEQAKATEEGRFYNSMAANLFSAFCIEAYLNHLGMEKVPQWGNLERKLSPRDKLDRVTTAIGYTVLYDRPPFQSFIEIFRFRDAVVHGKTAHLTDRSEQKLLLGQKPRLKKTSWEGQLRLEITQRFFDDTRKMIVILHSHAGYDQDPFSTQETAAWKSEFKTDDW